MKKHLMIFAVLVAVVTVLVIPMGVTAATSGDTAVTGNIGTLIDISVSGTASISLVAGTTPTTTGTVTVSCNDTSWTVSAGDSNTTVTNGFMTAYATTAGGYDPTDPAQLDSPMSVTGSSVGSVTGAGPFTLPTGGAIFTGSAMVSSQACTVTFSQPVSYADTVLTGDGSTTELPNTYRIVVTFTAAS
jgi:hypothetical protein